METPVFKEVCVSVRYAPSPSEQDRLLGGTKGQIVLDRREGRDPISGHVLVRENLGRKGTMCLG